MDDEPSLVPQWLKGGASVSSAFSSSTTTGSSHGTPALRDINISTKRNIPDWEDRHFSDRNFRPPRQLDSGPTKSIPEEKHWTPQPAPSLAVQRPQHLRSSSFSDDRQNNSVAYDPRRNRTFGGRPRDEPRNGLDYTGDILRDSSHRPPQPSSNPSYGAKVAFDRNFPTLGDHRQNGYTPGVGPNKQGFLASTGSGNWTSKLADSPTPPSAPRFPEETPEPARKRSPEAFAPMPVTPAPKMSETLQQKLHTRATSADRQRLDHLAAKQSRTLVPVLATSAKARTPSSKYMAPLRPDTKLSSRAAPLDTPFARKTTVPGPLDRASSLQRAHSANGGGAAALSPAPSAPSGMVSLKPAGSGKLNERTSVFDSLRRKPSLAEPALTEQLPVKLSSAYSVPPRAATQPTPAGASSDLGAVGPASAQLQGSAALPQSSAASDLQNNQQGSLCSGPAKLRALAEAEEEAFLRSLGWEEPEEGEEGGLTEEEIASFLAAAESRPKRRAAPLQLPVGASGRAAPLAGWSSLHSGSDNSGSESD